MKKILVADDDKKIAAALEIRLQAAGYDTVAVPDGFRSFMVAAGQHPDLILMDVCMPYGDGFAVVQELLDLHGAPIPVIFMTASRKEDLWARAQECGAAGFFEKPFDVDKLLNTIARTLREP
jgi:two-component system KDP operon response regulator KdpE